MILGIECVKSTHGLMRFAPAGMGSFISRMSTRSDSTMPAPAESPARMIDVGDIALCGAVGGGDIK